MSYIVPRDTPKTCSGCIFSRWSQIYEGKYWCVLNESDEAIYVELHQKSFNCPLIEVPTPHGRLVDIKSVEDRKFTTVDNEYERWWNGALDSVVDNAPTVIEAEGSEE